MALRVKKLHPDDIQGISDFATTYKCLATFAMTYKELTLNIIFLKKICQSVIVFVVFFSYKGKEIFFC
jgi:hypothetical protein